MLGRMDAAQAIAEMSEISPQVRDVVVVEPDGAVAGTNVAEESRAERLAEGGRRLLAAAEPWQQNLAQLEVATVGGSVFVIRDGGRMIVATTTPEPTVGLVFYDLKTCLRSVDEPKPAPRRRTARKDADAAA
jgi:predicted regulator of Ras-like GTPase activity (Roadblock/LC7/MglB family)